MITDKLSLPPGIHVLGIKHDQLTHPDFTHAPQGATILKPLDIIVDNGTSGGYQARAVADLRSSIHNITAHHQVPTPPMNPAAFVMDKAVHPVTESFQVNNGPLPTSLVDPTTGAALNVVQPAIVFNESAETDPNDVVSTSVTYTPDQVASMSDDEVIAVARSEGFTGKTRSGAEDRLRNSGTLGE